MTRISYLRFSALIPIVVPVPLAVLVFGTEALGAKWPQWVTELVMSAAMGLLLFTPIYVVVVGTLLYILRRRTWKAHLAGAFVAPWLMAAALGIFSVALDSTVSWSSATMIWGGYCLRVGYGYVFLAILGFVILERAGCVGNAA